MNKYYIRAEHVIIDDDGRIVDNDGSWSVQHADHLDDERILHNVDSWIIHPGETVYPDGSWWDARNRNIQYILARAREDRKDVQLKKCRAEVEQLQASLEVNRHEKAAFRAEIEQLKASLEVNRHEKAAFRAEIEQLEVSLAVLRLPPPIKYPVAPTEPEPASESLDEACACVICTERPKSTCMVPCGHTYACVTCVLKNKPIACGICRAPIEQVIRKYE